MIFISKSEKINVTTRWIFTFYFASMDFTAWRWTMGKTHNLLQFLKQHILVKDTSLA